MYFPSGLVTQIGRSRLRPKSFAQGDWPGHEPDVLAGAVVGVSGLVSDRAAAR
jgi:hypothetical protein